MKNNPFEFQSQENIVRGSENSDVSRLQEILQSFGYISNKYTSGSVCSRTLRGIKRFQRFFDLKVDGVVGPITKEWLLRKRCGVMDFSPNINAASESFVLRGCKYNKRLLTYAFVNGSNDLQGVREHIIVRQAFDAWQEVCGLTFEEVALNESPDFSIAWRFGNHADGSVFDGPSNTLAHAFFPPPCGGPNSGAMHFDEAETWTEVGSGNGIVLLQVAIHEIGHLLGLSHSDDENAIMFPYYSPDRVNLTQDDIDGVRELYGLAEPGVKTMVIGAADSNNLKQTHDKNLYEFEVPKSYSLLIDGPDDADFDLYLRKNKAPTTDEYDYVGYSSSADEKITFTVDPGDKYYVMVRSYSGSGDYSIELIPGAS